MASRGKCCVSRFILFFIRCHEKQIFINSVWTKQQENLQDALSYTFINLVYLLDTVVFSNSDHEFFFASFFVSTKLLAMLIP